jgi:ubiquinone/menaquinone biosynthesis C-methylase UbiE
LINTHLQSDFDDHWEKNFSESISQIKIREAEQYFKPVIDLLMAQPIKVFDGGCGDGVHWAFIRSLKNDRLNYTGIDISATAIAKLQKQNTTHCDRFLQMDLTKLTEPANSYDIVFSFGVIAYTTDPEKSFSELCRICKPGGRVGIWIYPEPQGLGKITLYTVRHICGWVGPFARRRIADLIVPFIGFLPTRSKMNLFNSSWKECREVILVNIAPRQLVFIQREEVLSWFLKHHIDIEYEDESNPITLWGRKTTEWI